MLAALGRGVAGGSKDPWILLGVQLTVNCMSASDVIKLRKDKNASKSEQWAQDNVMHGSLGTSYEDRKGSFHGTTNTICPPSNSIRFAKADVAVH